MPLNIGVYQGANVKVDYDARMQRNLQERAYERQTRVDAENKAKLLGEDFKLASVSSPYNRQRLNDFYKQKLTEMGKFVLQNNDLHLNPAKMLQFKMMKQELVDNDIVSEDMNFRTEYDATMKWLHENPDAAKDDPHVQEMLDEIENYRTFGTTDINAQERKKYTFINPDTKFDLGKSVADIFKNLKAQGLGATEDGRTYTYQRNEDLRAAADLVLANPIARRVATKEFQSLDPAIREKLYKNDLATYIVKTGEGFADPGQAPSDVKIFNPNTGRGGAGGGANGGVLLDPFQTQLKRAMESPTGYVRISPEIIKNAYSSDGLVDLSDGIIVSSRGESIDNPGKDFHQIPTDKQAMLLSSAKATNTGKILFDKKLGEFYTEWNIEMEGDLFRKFAEDESGIIDDNTGIGFSGSGDFTIHGENNENLWESLGDIDGSDKYTSTQTDKGTVVKFKIRKPLPKDDQPMALEMGKHWKVNDNFNYDQSQNDSGPVRPYIKGQNYPEGSPVIVNGMPGKILKNEQGRDIFIPD
jgi:hypothetical protein